MNTQRWEVLTLVGNHWENVWELDEQPETFDSYEDADGDLDAMDFNRYRAAIIKATGETA